jgi:hypothetical protein
MGAILVRVGVVVMVVAVMVVVVVLAHRLVHHPQHRAAARPEEAPDERCRHEQRDHVEVGRRAERERVGGGFDLGVTS